MRKKLALMIGIMSMCGSQAMGQSEENAIGQTLIKPIKIERNLPVVEVPLNLRSGKLYIQAQINNAQGEFIFDTGSPTMLTRQFAEQFDYDVIGKNTGQDANGVPVQMDIAIIESISIGGVTFHDVPVMIHDVSSVPLATCFMPNGVLGSELLPGSAWHLDVPASKILIASSSDELPKVAEAKTTALHLFGYPFAPIIDYSIGKFSDKALFDTGSASDVALFQDIASDKTVRRKIDIDTLQVGQGRHGVSAGGVSDVLPLSRFELKTFRMGDYDAGRVHVNSRPIPPTLIGAGILNSHTVTLDFPQARFLVAPSPTPLARKNNQGFALMLLGDTVEVVQIYDHSDAHKSGLKLGDKIMAINGRPLQVTTEAQRCETSLWLSNEFDAALTKTLTVKRDQELVDIPL